MKRILVAVCALVVLTTGCSEAQKRWVADRIASIESIVDPAEKSQQELELRTLVDGYNAYVQGVTYGYHCSEWFDLAMDVGFTPEQWQEPVSRIMFRESRCNPNADNPSSTANGLMQIVRGTWRGSCSNLPYLPYDPELNLRCAYQIHLSSGWNPWSTY